MSTRKTTDDPLRKATEADRAKLLDRVFYATGAMLDATDFSDEQAYHRGRLARALAYLHGAGTVAGLKVGVDTEPEEMVVVQPGMALDRLGRIIEVPRRACIRVDPWFRDKGAALNAFIDGGQILADVFIQFVSCERGKTPAFAAANANDRRAAMLDAVLNGWRETTEWWDEVRQKPRPLAEHDETQETTAVFLARVTIGTTPGADGQPPTRTPGATADNSGRPIVFTVGHWLGSAG